MPRPALGVGVVHAPALDELIVSADALVDVVEVEPQTFWRYAPGNGGRFQPDPGRIDHLLSLPQPKLVHGVGLPVGGTCPPDPRGWDLFAENVARLGAPWASEHLAFNRVRSGDDEFLTGFLLPPLPRPAGVRAAVATISAAREKLAVPFAVETGVNYLRPRPGDLSDGAFCAEIATRADCGILLDLHNLWANERNGRQSVESFVSELPLDRVWEIHLAGGQERRGYWLDAHSGRIPDPVMEVAAAIVPRLPNLGAIIFEIRPVFVERFGLDRVAAELERIHALWRTRPVDAQAPPPEPARPAVPEAGEARTGDFRPGDVEEAAAWERALGRLAVGRAPEDAGGRELAADPGIAVLAELVWEFRAGGVVDTLQLTSRLLMIALGEDAFRALLDACFAETTPKLFGSEEAETFARFLREHPPAVDHLEEVLGFELAAMRALLEGEDQTVSFTCEPMSLLQAVRRGCIPEDLPAGRYEVRVTPDDEAALAAQGHVVSST